MRVDREGSTVGLLMRWHWEAETLGLVREHRPLDLALEGSFSQHILPGMKGAPLLYCALPHMMPLTLVLHTQCSLLVSAGTSTHL